MLKILNINQHTPYSYLLAKTGNMFYMFGEWDVSERPISENIRIVSGKDIPHILKEIDVVIGHKINSDICRFALNRIRFRLPYIQIIHGSKYTTGFSVAKSKILLKHFYALTILNILKRLDLINIVFNSHYDMNTWPINGHLIRFGISLEEMYLYKGETESVLVVGNSLNRKHFDFKSLLILKNRLSLYIVGDTPNFEDSFQANSWKQLRNYYSEFRVLLNLAGNPERGYNLSMLEAMASGMPVVSVYHPNSPIQDGWSGFLVKDVYEMEKKCRVLLEDHSLARQMGANARETVKRHFSIDKFTRRWNSFLTSVVERNI